MSAINYSACIAEVLKHEGGWSNHPDDPGGATMRGVTQAVYDAYRKRNGLHTQTVRSIGEVELRDIYRKQYWDVIRGDTLPRGVDLALFDFAVNSGPMRATKSIQALLGLEPDGHLGERTLAAIKAADPRELVRSLCDRRMKFLQALKTWRSFGDGWTARVNAVRTRAVIMAASQSQKVPPIVEQNMPKPEDVASPKAKPEVQDNSTIDKAITIGTGASGALAAVLAAIQSPWGVAALAIVVVAAGVAAWRFWPREKMPELS